MSTDVQGSKSYLNHIFGVVADTLEVHLKEQVDLRDKLYTDLKRELGISKEIITITEDEQLVFMGRKLDLSGQPLMKRLFTIFLEHPRGRVNRDRLVQLVYGRNLDAVSVRRRMCDYHNIVKLVSRARKLGQSKLDNPFAPEWDWFAYDSMTEEWIIFRSRLPVH